MENKKTICRKAVAALILMAAATAILLFAAAAIVYYKELSASAAYIAIDVIYAFVGLSGGFFIGKMMRTHKFLWGLLAGLVYFCILLLVSLILNGAASADAAQLFLAFLLIEAPAMIGGMIS